MQSIQLIHHLASDAMHRVTVSPDRRSQIEQFRRLNDHGTLSLIHGRLHEAEVKLTQAIEGYVRLAVEDHGAFVAHYNLGTVYWKLGNIAEAEKMMQTALAGIRAVAPNDKHLPDVLNNLGLIYRDQRRLSEAQQSFEQAKREYQRILPPNHDATLRTDRNLRELSQEIELLKPDSDDVMDVDD